MMWNPFLTTGSSPRRDCRVKLGIGRICLDDASRSFEIILLMLSFLDEQFVYEFALPWLLKNATDRESQGPRQILELLVPRYYPNAVVFKKPAQI